MRASSFKPSLRMVVMCSLGAASFAVNGEARGQADGAPDAAVAAAPPAAAVDAPPGGESRHESGPYGGILAQLVLEPNGSGVDVCSAQGVTACSTGAPVGGGLMGYAGYMVDPVGVDVLVGLQIDATQASGNIDGVAHTVAIPRVGALFAIRARLAWQTDGARVSGGIGVGAAVRELGALGGSASTGYASPAVTIDGAAHWRLRPGAALSVGVMVWAENAGHGATLEPPPLTVPVHVASSTQVFVLPFVGLEVGP